MEREIAKLTTFQKYGEAEHLFNELKQRIPLDNKKNRQYVEYMSALFDLRIRQCDVNEVADRLIKAFSIIRGEMGLDNVGRFVPSRAEAIIINGIAVCYEAIGETDKSIELLEKTVIYLWRCFMLPYARLMKKQIVLKRRYSMRIRQSTILLAR